MQSLQLGFGLLAGLVVLAVLFDFLNGFHDAANSIATVVSTGVLKPSTAVLFASFFNVLAIAVFHLDDKTRFGPMAVETIGTKFGGMPRELPTPHVGTLLHAIKTAPIRELIPDATTIALLAAIAVPGFLRARKRSQATRILNDLRLVDAAVDQYAIETNRTTGDQVQFSDWRNYLKKDTMVYNTGADLFGHSFGDQTVDTLPMVPGASFNALSDVAPVEFWSPYQPGP